MPLKETGKKFGVTRERIRQLRRDAPTKLYEYMNEQWLVERWPSSRISSWQRVSAALTPIINSPENNCGFFELVRAKDLA